MGYAGCVADGETVVRRHASLSTYEWAHHTSGLTTGPGRFQKQMMRVRKLRSMMPGRAMKGRIMKRVPSVLKLAVAAGLCGGALFVGAEARPADQPNAMDKLKNLELREIGPAVMGGRIDDFAVVESNPNIVFVGVAAGGVWKTSNNGTTWTPVFDKEAVSTIGDIAIAPSDPSIVWVGSGEPNNRQSSSWGDGAYKSLDGGKTWQNMGLRAT